VDATGDANLAHLSEIETIFGDGKGNSQAATLMMRIDHVGKDVDFSPSSIKAAINAAKEGGIKYLTKETGIVIRKDLETDYVFAILPSINIDSLDAETLTSAEMNVRRQAQSYIKAFRKYLPGMENCTLVQTGPKLGIRESRRIIGEYTLTKEDVIQGMKSDDAIGRGAWPIEKHTNVNKMAEYMYMEDGDYYDIPIGVLKPRNSNNLWCGGRTISADSVAFASVRVMGIGFATGHAAGVSAAMTMDKDAYDVKEIQAELRRQGAII